MVVVKKFIVIFPDYINHSDMAAMINGTPVSAGFVSVGVGTDGEMKASCYGKSVSLGGLESQPEVDDRMVCRLLGLNRGF